MLCTATDVGIYGLLASQSCYHSMLAPCWFTLWTNSRFLYPYILLISLEIFLFSLPLMLHWSQQADIGPSSHGPLRFPWFLSVDHQLVSL